MKTIIAFIILALLIGCAGNNASQMKITHTSRDGVTYPAYLDTIDCEAVRKDFNPDDLPPPQTTPPPDGFMIHQDIPILLYEGIPDYPKDAVNKKITAEVVYSMYINELGCVVVVEIDSCTSPGYGFEEAVTDAVYESKYFPVSANGKTVGVWIRDKISFVLH